MMTRSAHSRGHGALATTWLLAAALSPAAMAFAQTAQPPAPGSAVPMAAGPAAPVPGAQAAAPAAQPGLFPAQPPPTPRQPGFIYEFGRWWDSTTHSGADSAAEATQDALKRAAEATKEAANALIRIPSARFIEVHQRCAIAPNGAPDCRSAAANVCRAKGFQDGNPINVQSSQNCPPAVWMSGRQPTAGECPQETVVLMVACR
jgi:hypothetical protein